MLSGAAGAVAWAVSAGATGDDAEGDEGVSLGGVFVEVVVVEVVVLEVDVLDLVWGTVVVVAGCVEVTTTVIGRASVVSRPSD